MPSGSGALGGAATGASYGSVFGPIGTGVGAVVGGLLGAFANKKKAAPTAPFTPTPLIDAQAEQRNAINGNLAIEGDLESLLARSNRFQQGQASDLLEQAVPGYGKLSASIAKRGQEAADHPYDLPPEVQDNLNRLAAERGVKVGTMGQTQKFSALRDLGVNMLDFGNQNFQKSIQALSTVTGLAPRVSPLSPLSFMLTPTQQLGIAHTNAGITQANNAGGQGTAQGGFNAQTAAQNWNSQNMWDNLLGALGIIQGMMPQGKAGGKT